MLKTTTAVTYDELTAVTPEDYAAFVERQREQSYVNEATLKDGVPMTERLRALKSYRVVLLRPNI